MLRNHLFATLLVMAASVYGQAIKQTESSFAKNENGAQARVALAAAKDGNYLAQYHVGTIYRTGYAGSPNYEQAAYWFRRSSESSYAKAQHALSELYLIGLGVARDFAEAARLEKLAALQGDASAQYGLGTLYQRGYGVERNFVRAYIWYDLSARNVEGMKPPFDKDASQLRDSVAKLLSPEQLQQAQKLSNDCSIGKIEECQ
jgi:TPR repeat protein